MRNVKMAGVVRLSMGRTVNILFKPLTLKKWLVLIFIGLFAGSMTSLNLNNSSSDRNAGRAAKGGYQAGAQRGAATVSGEDRSASQAQSGQRAAGRAAFPKIAIGVIGAIALFFIIFFVLALWVGCRFKFIWFNAISTNDASVIEPFHRHRMQGNSLFRASIIIALIFITAIAAVVGWGVFNAIQAGAFASGFAWSFAAALRLFGGPLAVFAVIALAAVILSVAIDYFAVMIMAIDKIAFMPALRKVAGIYKDNLRDIILFHMTLLLLGAACMLLTMAIGMAVAILVLLAGAVIFGLGYFALVTAAKMMIAFIIYCVVLGIPFIAAMILMFLCVQLPFSVFMKSFGIEYLCSLGCGYTYEKISEYAKERSMETSRAVVVIPVILIIMIVLVFIAGLLAAIAIPNFIRAREAAKQRQAESETWKKFSASYGIPSQK